jgi:NTP pyrophosphatase (non-canonical NTP hydrolase)
MKNLNEYRDKVNAWAERKGWNEQAPHVPDACMLFITELAEAKEDDRRNKMVTYLDEVGKPCGFPTELADTLIRILHLSGQLGVDLDGALSLARVHTQPFMPKSNLHVGWFLMEITAAVVMAYRSEAPVNDPHVKTFGPFAVHLAAVVIRLMELAELLDINLEYEVQVKMAYNETREKRHGGLRS